MSFADTKKPGATRVFLFPSGEPFRHESCKLVRRNRPVRNERTTMDLLLLLLIVLAVLMLSGWGYGYYAARPVAPGDAVAAPAGWVSPLGILALLAVVAIIAMLVTNWRPTGVVVF